MELNFYEKPFRKDKYSGWVYDAKGNFVFQFESKFTPEGNYADGVLDLERDVIFSLNAFEHDPIEGINLSVHPTDDGQILNNGEEFITIRGWGNLTGIGGHNFDGDKAAKIQDDFRDWIIYRLTPKV